MVFFSFFLKQVWSLLCDQLVVGRELVAPDRGCGAAGAGTPQSSAQRRRNEARRSAAGVSMGRRIQCGTPWGTPSQVGKRWAQWCSVWLDLYIVVHPNHPSTTWGGINFMLCQVDANCPHVPQPLHIRPFNTKVGATNQTRAGPKSREREREREMLRKPCGKKHALCEHIS